MNLLGVASFVWGLWHGYKHSSLIAVLSVSVALVTGDMLLNRKVLFRKDNLNKDATNFIGGIALYFILAFASSLISQGLGYLIGWLVR